MKRVFCTLLALSIVIAPGVSKGESITNSNLQGQYMNISEEGYSKPYKIESVESNEKSFVENLAESKGIPYDEAKKLNDENTMQYLKMRRPDLETRYTTQKQYYRVNSSISLVMAVEVKYIHNNYTGGNQIASLGEPYMGISGASLYRWSGGGFNKYVNVDSARISTTGQAYVEISNSVTGGIDVGGFTGSFSTGSSRVYTTPVKTYELKVYAKYL